MGPLLSALISAFVPVFTEGTKQFISHKLGGVKATTVQEQIQLDNNEIERLKAVAALDNPGGTPSQWVIDLRASARYVAAGVVIVGGGALAYMPEIPEPIKLVAIDAVSTVFGFLFGTRLVANVGK
jgi:hypothetical protein